MVTQEIPISLLMDPQKMLIFRKGDYGNQIKIKFPDLTGITSAEFRFIKPDDTFVVSTGEIIENDIIITITQQMSILSGYAIFNLRLINSQSNIYTYVGRALIDENINLDDYAASVAEVNGLVFPDDFLTSADLSQYATKTYVNEAIAEAPTYTPPNYSTTEQDTGLKWIDGKPIYRRTFDFSIDDLVNGGFSSSQQYGEFDIDSYFSDAETIWIDQSNSFIFGSTTIVSHPINYASGSGITRANVQRSTRNSHLIIYFDNTYSASKFYTDRALLHFIFTIQYTKTTDTV